MKTSQKYLDKLEEIKAWIIAYWEKNHFSPSTWEMKDAFETSTSVVAYWLDRLEKDGWIEPRAPGVSRNIVPVEIFAKRPVFPGKVAAHDPGI